MKSSDPVYLRPSTIARGGSGANQINGVASSDKDAVVLVLTGGEVRVGTGTGADVEVDVTSGKLHEVRRIKSMGRARKYFMAYTFCNVSG
jgi:hypothetical protein